MLLLPRLYAAAAADDSSYDDDDLMYCIMCLCMCGISVDICSVHIVVDVDTW